MRDSGFLIIRSKIVGYLVSVLVADEMRQAECTY